MPHSETTATGAAGAAPDSCPLCVGYRLVRCHCKYICPTCGYVESCEDLFVHHGVNASDAGNHAYS